MMNRIIDSLRDKWLREWVYLLDGTFGIVRGVIDSKNLKVELYIKGPGGISNSDNWKSGVSVPVCSAHPVSE